MSGDRLQLRAVDGAPSDVGLKRSPPTSAPVGPTSRPAPDPSLSRRSPVIDLVVTYLRAQADALRAVEPLVRRGEPDAVHQMRVACRRLRSVLRSFGRVLPGAEVPRLIGELKWLADALARERDNEVVAGHLRAELDELPAELVIGPVRARIVGHYATRGAVERAAVLETLDSERCLRLLQDIDRLVAEPPRTPAGERSAARVVPRVAAREYRRVSRRMDRAAGLTGSARDVALHDARKAAKRARYTAEVAAPVFGKSAKRFRKSMKRVQTLLGEHQDTVETRHAVRHLAVRAFAEGENTFTYGLLHERDTTRAAELRERSRQAWKRAGTRKRRALTGR